MADSKGFPAPARSVCTRTTRAVLVFLACAGASLLARQAATPAAAALTLSIKGSAPYAKPAPVPLPTALLVVTPVWEDVAAQVTSAGGNTAVGTVLFVSDFAVVLSNTAMDCTTVFATHPTASPQDFLIAAGQVLAYEPAKGWQSTSIGKLFVDIEKTPARNPIDKLSVEAQYTVQKKKVLSKDNVKGNTGHLILEQNAGKWAADFAFQADEISAEGKIPLTLCPVVTRKQAAGAPLLGMHRIHAAVENY